MQKYVFIVIKYINICMEPHCYKWLQIDSKGITVAIIGKVMVKLTYFGVCVYMYYVVCIKVKVKQHLLGKNMYN